MQPDLRRHRRDLILALLLLLLAAGRFHRLASNDFVNVDDREFLLENQHVLHGLSWQGVRWAFTSVPEVNWYPLTWITHMADFQFYGLWAGGHHLTSLAIHAASVLLLFLFLRGSTGAVGRSFVAAAIFAIHPFQVESVAWTFQRSSVLCGFFFMLGLVAYGAYAKRGGAARYAAVLGCYLAGLMSKPVAVTLPLVLLILDVWPLGRAGAPGRALSPREALRCLIEKVPFFGIAAVASLVTLRIQKPAMQALAGLSFRDRLENGLVAYVTYVGKFLWPRDFAVLYVHPASLPVGTVLLATAILAAVTILAAALQARGPWLLTGWLWFLVTLLPMSGLVQVGMQAMADRYMYLPIVGLALAVSWTGAMPWTAPSGGRKNALIAASVLLLLALAGRTWVQTGLWRGPRTLYMAQFVHELRAHPRDPGLRVRYGTELLTDSRMDEARAQFRIALAIDPRFAPAHRALGDAFASEGKRDEAIGEYVLAARLAPADPEIQRAVGKFLLVAGRPADAIIPLREASRLAPRDAEARVQLGLAYMSIDRPLEAAAAYEEALKIRPGDPITHYNYAEIFARSNQLDKAALHYGEAVRLSPGFYPARFNLGVVLARAGKTEDAKAELLEALRLKPDLAPAHTVLGDLLEREGRHEEAVAHYREAVRINPEDVAAQDKLQLALNRVRQSKPRLP